MIEPITLTLPMHGRSETRPVQLIDILESIDGNDLTWVVKFFDAISREDSSFDVLELEERIASTRGEGLPFTNAELLSLARETDQIIDCEILGFAKANPHAERSEPVAQIEASDSTEWTVVVDRAVVQTSLV